MARGCFDVCKGPRLILPFNKKIWNRILKPAQEKVRHLKYWADVGDLWTYYNILDIKISA